MSEDISASVRTGITVILVAALVATILNLMVVAQSIMGSGQTKLQSGIDQINVQEFASYDQKKVSGTMLKSAISLFNGRDIAIVVRNNACIAGNGAPAAYNYGAILEVAEADDSNDTGLVYTLSDVPERLKGETYYRYQLENENGIINTSSNIKGISTTGDTEFVLESARFRSELIKDNTDTIVGILFTQL